MMYLDNNATTPIDPEVYEAMLPYLKDQYGNPSSKYYDLATNAKKAVEIARNQVADLIGASPEEIIFTGGATESNNFIIKGVMDFMRFYENKGNHLITTETEHKSVIQIGRFLSGEAFNNDEKTKGPFAPKVKIIDRGYDVSFLPVNPHGQVELTELESSLKDTTTLVSIIWGNNEIGSLNDIAKLGELTRSKGVLFHTDATQIIGKLPVNVQELPIDFMSFSGHKIYGPKGIGVAYIKKSGYVKPKLTSLVHGGSHENGYRAGTLAVHNIVGIGKACEILMRDMEKNLISLKKKEAEMREMLITQHPDIEFIGHPTERLPGTISFILPSENNELYIKKIANEMAISSGSACSISEPSHVLKAIGREMDSDHFLRIGLGKSSREF